MSAKEESTALMNATIPFAKQLLEKDGEFRPYGGYLKVDGTIVDVGLEIEDHLLAADVVSIYLDRFREMSKDEMIAAFALVFMVNITCPNGSRSDAIQVNVDHREGYSAEVLYPYTIEANEVDYGAMFAQKGTGQMFTLLS